MSQTRDKKRFTISELEADGMSQSKRKCVKICLLIIMQISQVSTNTKRSIETVCASALYTFITHTYIVLCRAGLVRRAGLHRGREDQSVQGDGGRAAFRRDEVQAEAERGAGRGRRNRR